jgi:hypothetical protein
MRGLVPALFHLAVVTAKLGGSGGVRAVMAESLAEAPLIVLRRARKRAPNLTVSDRFHLRLRA